MLKLITLEDFIDEINKIIYRDACTVIEAIIAYAEEKDIEFDSLVPYINSSFKDAIREEAESKNMMKSNNGKLPL